MIDNILYNCCWPCAVSPFTSLVSFCYLISSSLVGICSRIRRWVFDPPCTRGMVRSQSDTWSRSHVIKSAAEEGRVNSSKRPLSRNWRNCGRDSRGRPLNLLTFTQFTQCLALHSSVSSQERSTADSKQTCIKSAVSFNFLTFILFYFSL